MADKFPTPTIFLDSDTDDRLYIAARHLEITRTEFITQAIMIALDRHESKYGKIMSTGDMTIKAKEGSGLAPDQIGDEEKAQIRKDKKR